ncbi:MAG: alpha/beta hydrolase [Microcoleaceae cyanobacterium]
MRLSLGRWFEKVSPLGILQGRISKYVAVGLAMMLSVTASWLIITNQPTPAIDELQLRYGAATIGLPFEDLEVFSETGEQSNQLRSLFTLAQLTDEQIDNFQDALNFGVDIPADIVDTLLDSSYGRLAVGAAGLFVEPGSGIDQVIDRVLGALRQATRDGNLTVLELILGYRGIDVISINVEQLLDIYNDAVDLGEQAVDFLKAQPRVQELICQ